MNNSNVNTRNHSQSTYNNISGLAQKRSNMRTTRAFSDPTLRTTVASNRKRNAEIVALGKNEKYLNYSEKALANVEKSIKCHEKNGWFCTKPEKLFPKEKGALKYEPSLNGLKKYKSFLNSSIKFTSNSIETRKKRINPFSPPRAPLYPVKSGYQNGYQNHRRNNFLNPNNMQHSSSGGNKRRTRRYH